MKYELRENQGIPVALLALMAVATGLSVPDAALAFPKQNVRLTSNNPANNKIIQFIPMFY